MTKHLELPQLVLNRYAGFNNNNAALLQLSDTLLQLEELYNIQVERVLTGGSSAMVAQTQHGQILKINLVDLASEEDFLQEVTALRLANGRAHAQLIQFEEDMNFALIEKLGKPLGNLDFSSTEQIQIICQTLQSAWIPLKQQEGLSNTIEIADWFSKFITESWVNLGQPFSRSQLEQVQNYLNKRKTAYDDSKTYLVHGDPHNFNILQAVEGNNDAFKFIDPDGLISEPAYDLGVLMREWTDELLKTPEKALKARLELLHELTYIDKTAIWQWGLIQILATAMVLLQSNQKEEADKLIHLSTFWTEEHP